MKHVEHHGGYTESLTEFFTTGRRQGKTFRLLTWLSQDPERAVIVHSGQAEKELRRQFQDRFDREMPNEVHIVGGPYTAMDLRGRRFQHEVGIDNLDLIMQNFLGVQPSVVTMTGTVWEDPEE